MMIIDACFNFKFDDVADVCDVARKDKLIRINSVRSGYGGVSFFDVDYCR